MSPPANPALPHTAPADAAGALASLLQEPAPRPWRHAPTVAGVLAAHLAGGWALMQVDAVREAMHEAMPLMVELLPAPPQQPPPPPPPPQRVAPPPRPAPIIVAEPTPAAPEPPVFEAPPPPVEPPPPMAVVETAPPAPPAAPAPPAEPEMVAATDVRYLQPLNIAYPAFSKRRREAGMVMLLVRVSATGLPVRVEVQQSSGFPRLDEAAVAAMRAARFVPLTRNGVPQEMMTLAPIEFSMEN